MAFVAGDRWRCRPRAGFVRSRGTPLAYQPQSVWDRHGSELAGRCCRMRERRPTCTFANEAPFGQRPTGCVGARADLGGTYCAWRRCGHTVFRSMPQIPVARPKLPVAERIAPYLRAIDASRFYTNFGPLASSFEERIAARYGLPSGTVTTVANATWGLTLALGAQDAKPGTLCVMPAWTFIASAHAAANAGLVPYFVDVDPETWAIDASAVADEIRRAPAPVGAVMPVSPFGRPISIPAWTRSGPRPGWRSSSTRRRVSTRLCRERRPRSSVSMQPRYSGPARAGSSSRPTVRSSAACVSEAISASTAAATPWLRRRTPSSASIMRRSVMRCSTNGTTPAPSGSGLPRPTGMKSGRRIVLGCKADLASPGSAAHA